MPGHKNKLENRLIVHVSPGIKSKSKFIPRNIMRRFTVSRLESLAFNLGEEVKKELINLKHKDKEQKENEERIEEK